jgi:TonB family protein
MSHSERAVHETANDRFKRGFGRWFWIAMILATLAHFAAFAGSPTFGIQDFSFTPSDVALVDLVDEIVIPPAPAAIARPATPVIAEVPDLSTELTIAPTTFSANPVEALPEPPGRDQGEVELAAAPTFTPMTVRPRLLNGDEMARLLVRYYPPLLRDAGIGGTVRVWFFIDQTGCVQRTLINESSGFDAFDRAALQVADRMRFAPAYNRDQAVPVWVSLDVRFEVQS